MKRWLLINMGKLKQKVRGRGETAKGTGEITRGTGEIAVYLNQ